MLTIPRTLKRGSLLMMLMAAWHADVLYAQHPSGDPAAMMGLHGLYDYYLAMANPTRPAPLNVGAPPTPAFVSPVTESPPGEHVPLVQVQALYDYYRAMSSQQDIRPPTPAATPRSPYRTTSAGPAPVADVVPPVQEILVDAAYAPAPHKRTDLFWATLDYVAVIERPMQNQTALATTGNAANLIPGALGQSGTTVLFGGNIDLGIFSGTRLSVGRFFDKDGCFSIEASGFTTFAHTRSFVVSGDASGTPVIARPVFNTDDGFKNEAAFLTSAPTLFTGTLAIDATSLLSGGEINARFHYKQSDCFRWDTLLGTRYLRLSESLRFRDDIVPLANNQVIFRGASVNSPNSLADQDLFVTSTQFLGLQVGARASWQTEWFTLGGFGKLAVGANQERVQIQGATTLITPTGNSTSHGGVLAQASNIGSYRRTILGLVPEFGFDLGLNMTDHIRLRLGYSFLFWDHVVRPAGQIDRNIAFGQAPGAFVFGTTTGPGRPSFRFNDEVFWAHLLTAGLEAHY